MCDREKERVCVCGREKERARVCVRERACVREREKERESAAPAPTPTPCNHLTSAVSRPHAWSMSAACWKYRNRSMQDICCRYAPWDPHMSIVQPSLLTTLGREAPTPGFLVQVLQNFAGGAPISPPPSCKHRREGGGGLPRVERLQHQDDSSLRASDVRSGGPYR